jgi:citrate lyase subunit alpha/citrate CoA-transferase
VTTPGSTIDVVVTEAGVAVNPLREELAARLVSAGVNVVPLARLHDLSQTDASPMLRADAAADQAKKIVALQQYRDGTVIDVLRQAGSLS